MTWQVAWNVKKTNIHGWCHKLRKTKMLDIFFSVVLGVFYPSSKQEMNKISNEFHFVLNASIGVRPFPLKPSEFEKLYVMMSEEFLKDLHVIQLVNPSTFRTCWVSTTQICRTSFGRVMIGVLVLWL